MGEREEEEEIKEGQDQLWEGIGEMYTGQETEQRCIAMGDGELEVSTRTSQMLGK